MSNGLESLTLSKIDKTTVMPNGLESLTLSKTVQMV